MYTFIVTEQSVLDSINLESRSNNLSKAICDIDVSHSDVNLLFNSLGFIAKLINLGKLYTHNPETDTRNFNIIKINEVEKAVKYKLLILAEYQHAYAGPLTVTLFSLEKIYLGSVAYFKYSIDYNLFNWYYNKFKDVLPEDVAKRIFVDALRYNYIPT